MTARVVIGQVVQCKISYEADDGVLLLPILEICLRCQHFLLLSLHEADWTHSSSVFLVISQMESKGLLDFKNPCFLFFTKNYFCCSAYGLV